MATDSAATEGENKVLGLLRERIQQRTAKVVGVGLGYVGLPLALEEKVSFAVRMQPRMKTLSRRWKG